MLRRLFAPFWFPSFRLSKIPQLIAALRQDPSTVDDGLLDVPHCKLNIKVVDECTTYGLEPLKERAQFVYGISAVRLAFNPSELFNRNRRVLRPVHTISWKL